MRRKLSLAETKAPVTVQHSTVITQTSGGPPGSVIYFAYEKHEWKGGETNDKNDGKQSSRLERLQ